MKLLVAETDQHGKSTEGDERTVAGLAGLFFQTALAHVRKR